MYTALNFLFKFSEIILSRAILHFAEFTVMLLPCWTYNRLVSILFSSVLKGLSHEMDLAFEDLQGQL